MTWLTLAIFLAVYAGMAAGRWPGLAVDRTGIAVIGGLAMVISGAVAPEAALAAIDWPTLILLFALMILSAQFALAGFYDRAAARLAAGRVGPALLLGLVVAVSGLTSAVLSNDVVVFALALPLARGVWGRGLDPRPFVLGLAGGANAGSALTLIGNPQNILIGQLGGLDFWSYAAAAAVPSLAALLAVHLAIVLVWRRRWHLAADSLSGTAPDMGMAPAVDRPALIKAVVALVAVLVAFSTPVPHVEAAVAIAAALMISRRIETRRLLAEVDWSLLLLFAGLFVVTGAFAATGLPGQALAWLAGAGIAPDRLAVMAPLTLAGSNTIGNVPLVMLLLAIQPDWSPAALTALAVLSTLAGNFLVVGSLANIIAVERVRSLGLVVDFATHARSGVPMTLAGMGLALLWFVV
ncbi:SLC13 family permease [uncultured Tistrella sp.]|uniref:SLC13 family permease n=1 Tax=Tistrella mobilis TaxID=171437 RepID=UPI000C0AAE57|nr:SLC13 family permease [uncultured Tistrella sp.]MAM75679.1 anion transporter [Tistrella sp.]